MTLIYILNFTYCFYFHPFDVAVKSYDIDTGQ